VPPQPETVLSTRRSAVGSTAERWLGFASRPNGSNTQSSLLDKSSAASGPGSFLTIHWTQQVIRECRQAGSILSPRPLISLFFFRSHRLSQILGQVCHGICHRFLLLPPFTLCAAKKSAAANVMAAVPPCNDRCGIEKHVISIVSTLTCTPNIKRSAFGAEIVPRSLRGLLA